MSNFVVSLPGTLKAPLTPETKGKILAALQGTDPHEVAEGESADLDALSLNPDTSTFTLRLEVEAENSGTARAEALALAESALRGAGLDEQSAPLGNPVITAIDVN
ncbi:hypothetical protein G3I60_06295 [Streptomyces sp. SID13666]|uniref:hypothetical protein n=1 Tax=unclassified Streptomyces TaxID=2593676 RepID=UPI0013BF4F99|nr:MULTISPECIES: hypothetical protein [unclassified Streptomyces]NEA53779.1 hypothetical protein [Streptomyces sp. SID13666]NEA71557.1 hypothetical protein [Streptomyces sp. SID13588]